MNLIVCRVNQLFSVFHSTNQTFFFEGVDIPLVIDNSWSFTLCVFSYKGNV